MPQIEAEASRHKHLLNLRSSRRACAHVVRCAHVGRCAMSKPCSLVIGVLTHQHALDTHAFARREFTPDFTPERVIGSSGSRKRGCLPVESNRSTGIIHPKAKQRRGRGVLKRSQTAVPVHLANRSRLATSTRRRHHSNDNTITTTTATRRQSNAPQIRP